MSTSEIPAGVELAQRPILWIAGAGLVVIGVLAVWEPPAGIDLGGAAEGCGEGSARLAQDRLGLELVVDRELVLDEEPFFADGPSVYRGGNVAIFGATTPSGYRVGFGHIATLGTGTRVEIRIEHEGARATVLFGDETLEGDLVGTVTVNDTTWSAAATIEGRFWIEVDRPVEDGAERLCLGGAFSLRY